MEYKHVSVMLNECLQALNVYDGGTYFDGTLGGAGHTTEILKLCSPHGRVIATDLDDDAIANAKEKLKEYKNNFLPFKSNFKNFLQVLEQANIDFIDGALLDLGISSYQLDADRGFAYIKNSPLDMRMNQQGELNAETVVNEYSEEQLTEIFYKYGEESFSKKIAKNICIARQIKPIKTTFELVDIIDKSIPAKFKTNGHPAKKVFQAIRIEVNGELQGLEQCLKDIVSKLKVGGRLAVITFHSLEDRIVKNTFADLAKDCICDKRLPVCVCGNKRQIKIINTKPIVASEQELKLNSRSKSAKLRIVEKV